MSTSSICRHRRRRPRRSRHRRSPPNSARQPARPSDPRTPLEPGKPIADDFVQQIPTLKVVSAGFVHLRWPSQVDAADTADFVVPGLDVAAAGGEQLSGVLWHSCRQLESIAVGYCDAGVVEGRCPNDSHWDAGDGVVVRCWLSLTGR